MQIFVVKVFEFRGGNHETHNQIEYTYKGFKGRVTPTSRAYSVFPNAAAAANIAAAATSAAGADYFLFLLFLENNESKRHNMVTDTYDSVHRYMFVLVQHNAE